MDITILHPDLSNTKICFFLFTKLKTLIFPGGVSGKEPACQCRRHETQVRFLGQEDPLEEGGHGNPLQYSCLENPTDGGAWRATVHEVTQTQT